MMKKAIKFGIGILFLAACAGKSDQQKLEKLKKEKAEIQTKIEKLTDEIRKAGGDTLVKEKLKEVACISMEPKTFKSFIEVQGRVDAEESVALSSMIMGTVTQILVKPGDEVAKGQTLAETDTRAMQQQLSDLQVNLEMANELYQKQKNLWDQKIGTEIQYLQTKTAKESLEKKMGALQEQIRMGKIITPISGTIDGVNIKIGQMIAPGLPAITVINFANLKVKADVAEKFAGRVRKGNEVKIQFPDTHDSITAKVSFAARGINALNRTFLVEILLDPGKEYHPNMVAKLKINDYTSSSPVMVIPMKFVQRGTKDTYIFVVNEKKVVRKIIEIGRIFDGLAEIKSGLQTGDKLIVAGYDMVNEGDLVLVK